MAKNEEVKNEEIKNEEVINEVAKNEEVSIEVSELPTVRKIVKETDDYIIYQNPKGSEEKFSKEMKYKKIWTSIPETDEDKKKFFRMLNDFEADGVIPMSESVGVTFTLKNFYLNPYNSFDKDTGEDVSGVTSLVEDSEGNYYATSSKTVYYDLLNIQETFGAPSTVNYIPVDVVIKSTKRENGKQISLSIV